MARPRLILNLPNPVLDGREPLKHFYDRLCDGLQAKGVTVALMPHRRETLLAEVAADRDFHIVDHGTERHPRILNAGIAYVFPYWNLDPSGIRACSSIGTRAFPRREIDASAANAFFRDLRHRLVKPRRSRGEQPAEKEIIPDGCVAIFLQSDQDPMVRRTAWMSRRSMVAAALARADAAPIVIKPHPRDVRPATRRWLDALARSDPRLHITGANIHDILAAAKVVVTINSATGIEAMLHRKPVVICGRADFHHVCVEARSPGDIDAAIRAAMAQSWPQSRFLYWYFRIACLDATSPTLAEEVLARIAATGFDTASFAERS